MPDSKRAQHEWGFNTKIYKVVNSLQKTEARSVCLGHMTNAIKGFAPNGFFKKAFGGYGWLGVEISFVISGFVNFPQQSS